MDQATPCLAELVGMAFPKVHYEHPPEILHPNWPQAIHALILGGWAPKESCDLRGGHPDEVARPDE
jgi:hypothetical protein